MLARLTQWGAVVTVAVLMVGCPEVAPRGADAAAPSDGEAARLLVPPEGAAVPTNLSRVVVAGADAIELPGVRTQPLPKLRCQEGPCVGLQLLGPLAPQAAYSVHAGTAELPLSTAAGPDHVPPHLIVSARVEGHCAAIHISADEPVSAVVQTRLGDEVTREDAARLAQDLTGALADGHALVAAVDLAGNLSSQWLALELVDAPLVVTEVMAHPLGTQPQQEWVELHNVSAATASTAGLALAAGSSSDPLPEALIPAGGYAVVVPAGWRTDGPDVPPAPTAAIIRLASTTIGSGLGNSGGSSVELRDAMGRVLSRYGGWIDVSARSARGTSAARTGDGDCDSPRAWRAAPHPTPGAPN